MLFGILHTLNSYILPSQCYLEYYHFIHATSTSYCHNVIWNITHAQQLHLTVIMIFGILPLHTRSTATSYCHNDIWNITTTHTLNIYILLSQCYLEYYHYTHAQHLHLTVTMLFGILPLHTCSTSTSYCHNIIGIITTSHMLNIYILLSQCYWDYYHFTHVQYLHLTVITLFGVTQCVFCHSQISKKLI